MKTIPFETLDLQGQGTHILIEVEIYHKKQKMVIDTGASKTVFDQQQLTALFQDDIQLSPSETLSTGLGTNSMESFIVELPALKIGNWHSKDLNVAALDLSTINYAYQQIGLAPVIGVIGGDILMTYGAIIDYSKKTLKLRDRKMKSVKI